MDLNRASEQGLAMVTVLFIMSFLTILGSALLSSTTVDVHIADNYRINTQLTFLAEAGIEDGRDALFVSNDIGNDLTTAAGADGVLATSLDLTTLLASDDLPLLPSDPGLLAAGETLLDASGQEVGTYHVFLRNDVVDAETSTADTNDVVTLLSIARIGDGIKTIETVVKRGSFPPIPAALTLNGEVEDFDPSNSNIFDIDGNDAGGGPAENAIGVISPADDAAVSAEIPAIREDQYTGVSGATPDVEDVSGDLAGILTSVAGLESLVESMVDNATDLYEPGFGNVASIGNIGGPNDYRAVVVNGDCEFGPGNGYGTLVVRGDLTFEGNFSWNGLILVIGQGNVYWNGGGIGQIEGGMFLADTRNDPTPGNPLGALLATRGDVIADFNGGGGNGIQYNTSEIHDATSAFPYSPISIREYN